MSEPATPGQDDALLLSVVRDLVAERYTVDRAAGTRLDSVFDRDLGLDSLAVTELISRVEDAFGVSLDHGVLGTVTTPRQLLTAVHHAPARERRRPVPARRAAPPCTDRTPDATATLTEALSWHARTHPDRVHLRILTEGHQSEISYGELHSAAATVSAALLAHDLRPGDAVGLMLPTSRDYFTTFTGVLLAGGVPVPVYPPARPSQLAEHLRRQVHILDNARTRVLVTDPEAARLARLTRGQVETVRHVLTPGDLAGCGEATGGPRGAGDIALLQYTSGSTGDPKGVTLTHANLLANIRAMGKAAEVSTSDVFVSWLPLYHDMGLIGAWLSGLYFGVPLAVMSPLEFLARPAQWLWAIHTHRGTLSAAPNFAYELCLRRIADADVEGLDLGSLRMLFNGAEAVNADTVIRFGERFAAYGLRRESLAPVYGLAEACVGLTFPPVGRGPVIDSVARERFLRTGRAAPPPTRTRTRCASSPAAGRSRITGSGWSTRLRTCSATGARAGSSSAAPRPPRGTSATRRRPRRCPGTAGSTPATSAISTTANSTSPAASRTSSSARAATCTRRSSSGRWARSRDSGRAAWRSSRPPRRPPAPNAWSCWPRRARPRQPPWTGSGSASSGSPWICSEHRRTTSCSPHPERCARPRAARSGVPPPGNATSRATCGPVPGRCGGS
ncbi:AMP-binding protein [Rhodococcus aetherivorans]